MTKTNDDVFYEAFVTRDPKFDGKFFLGVKTTGIYCRPICPARPLRKNIEFFTTALKAEKTGYRPCLRCRPESAPDSPLWHGTSSVVKRAVRMLDDESVLGLNEHEFAEHFATSSRHLRRIFKDELGKTPAQIKQDQRLNLAKKLIVETAIPFVDIAFSAGFNSVRRFNDAVKKRFLRTPTELRKRNNSDSDPTQIELSLAYRPPIDWLESLAYYEKHKIGDLEKISEGVYTRTFQFEKQVGMVNVSNISAKNQLLISLKIADINAIGFVLRRIKEMFDLSLDPIYVTNSLQQHSALKPLCMNRNGARMVRCWDQFELAVSAILGQVISISHATQLTRQIMELYGQRKMNPFTKTEIILFPTPSRLAAETLASLKVPQIKKDAIISLSRQVASGEIHFSSYQDPQAFKDKLLAIRGIGRWTAEYIALRAIGDADAYPMGDVYLDKLIDPTTIKNVSPWRGYLASYLYKYGGKL